MPLEAPLAERTLEGACQRVGGKARPRDPVVEVHARARQFPRGLGLREAQHIASEVREDPVHEVHQDGRRSEALAERFARAELGRVGLRDLRDEAGRAAAPAVDRLLGVADEKEAARLRGVAHTEHILEERPKGEELLDGGVLRLVDREVAQIDAERRAKLARIRHARAGATRSGGHAPRDVAEAEEPAIDLEPRERAVGHGQQLAHRAQLAPQVLHERRTKMRQQLGTERSEVVGNRGGCEAPTCLHAHKERALRDRPEVACVQVGLQLHPRTLESHIRLAALRRRHLQGARERENGIPLLPSQPFLDRERFRPPEHAVDRLLASDRDSAVHVERRHRVAAES